jgi:asparagine synthase (glutamine-hydrolysing)
MVSPLELNPDAVPQYLLYRTLSGDMTYFKDVSRLLPGHLIKFREGDWRLEQIERLDDFIPQRRFSQVSPEIVAEFDQQAEQVIGSYVKQITELGHTPGMLLSGGVDSSLLASLIESNLAPQDKLQSISYIMRVPSFTDEVKYAQHAIDLLGANHKFVDVYPADYPHLLEQTIDLLARPLGDEQVPCYLALAHSLSIQEPRYLLSGTAADTLLGITDSKRLLQVELFRDIPGAGHALGFLGKSLRRVLPNKAYGMREIAGILPSLSDPLSFYAPLNYNPFTNFETVQQCFDANTIRREIEYRRALFGLYSNSSSLIEQVHFIEFTHVLHDEGVNVAELYQAHALTDVAPFLDSDFIRHALAFEPNIRFYSNGRAKWLPKQLVENRLQSQTTQWPKLAGGFDNELFQWMKDGVLRDMVSSIERPGYMSQTVFEQKREEPDWFTWSLLMLDLFQKRFLKTGV